MKLFNKVEFTQPRSNTFDLSHERKMSIDFGKLYPTIVQEVVPGDRFRVHSETFLRAAALMAPLMHRVNVYTHFFFVPNRILWEDWEDFITGGEDGTSTPTHPKMAMAAANEYYYRKGRVSDYLGLPIVKVGDTGTDNVSALPFRAYAMIWNEYYRDQNVQDKLVFSLGSTTTSDLDELCMIQRRCWEKDYYTSCLPWAQRGGSVSLPIEGEMIPVYKDPTTAIKTAGGNAADGDIKSATGDIQDSGSNDLYIKNLEDPQDVTSGISVNDLRTSLSLQRWLEKSARGGSRYAEQIRSFFGVNSPDSRLQRPEYLGGGKQPVVISEVLNTTGTATLEQGHQAGHAISVGRSNSFKSRFTEHGVVMGIMSVVPRTTYQQGVSRMYKKFDKHDHYFPEFAHLGEQAVLNSELFQNFDTGDDPTGTFGYQSRYAEYKYNPSTVHGDFRDDLDYWHMGRQFATEPTLNSEFVRCTPREDLFPVGLPAYNKLYVQIYNNVRAVRPMPYFGTPKI